MTNTTEGCPTSNARDDENAAGPTTNTETGPTLLRRTSSAVWERRPRTPAGWFLFIDAIALLVVRYELRLQRQLTRPPCVFFQNDADNPRMRAIHRRMTTEDAILSQPIRPSLWVGTRSALSSGLAVVMGHPSDSDRHVQFREIVTVPVDGATLALDWEAPKDTTTKDGLLKGPIHQAVVLVLHGLNNDSRSSYIRSLQRTFSNRGWVTAALNFRGCGGIPNTNLRPYTGAYTGDLRSVVHMMEGRLAPGVPLFLVGNSLGANLITKYLGEEGLSGTLPSCVKGGVSLANPLHIHSKNNVHTPMTQLMVVGVKLAMLAQWKTWAQTLNYAEFREALKRVLKATTIDQVDAALCPIILRNEPHYPFAVSIGYDSVEDYWNDCSSYRMLQHVSVPLLQIIAGDDPVVYHAFQNKLAQCGRNPNVMSVETKCGGHLGWQESPPPRTESDEDGSGFRPTWAGRAAADFIDAILTTRPQTVRPVDDLLPPKPDDKQPPNIPFLQSRL